MFYLITSILASINSKTLLATRQVVHINADYLTNLKNWSRGGIYTTAQRH